MSAEDLLQRIRAEYSQRNIASVECPEWGATIYFRPPNMATLARVNRESKGDPVEVAARLVAICACDAAGERLFKPAEYRTFLQEATPGVVQRVSDAIMASAGMAKSEAELAADAKN